MTEISFITEFNSFFCIHATYLLHKFPKPLTFIEKKEYLHGRKTIASSLS